MRTDNVEAIIEPTNQQRLRRRCRLETSNLLVLYVYLVTYELIKTKVGAYALWY